MKTTKLTLSADRELIQEAKKFAGEEKTSLSSMVARFLIAVMQERRKKGHPGPMTRRATGLVTLPGDKSDKELLETAMVERYEH